MKTLHDIYSRIANDIQDNTFALISKGEYISMADNTAEYLSKYVDIYVKEIVYKATAEVYSFAIPTLQSEFVTTDNISLPTGDHYRVNRLLKVVRYNQDCREVSWTAVESMSRGNSPFKVNDSQLDYRFFATRVEPNGDISLHWGTPIAVDEEVRVFALCDIPTQTTYATGNLAGDFTPKWSEFKDFTPIPSLIATLFYKHMLKEALSALMLRQGDVWANRLLFITNEVKLELAEVRKYISNLKDKSSLYQVQPFKWLSEDEGYGAPTGDPNIPAEMYSKIIL